MKKILIIEDNENLGKILEKFFQSKDFDVALVHDGMVGLNELKSLNPDIALLDMSLPSMNGYEILEARSKDPNIAKIPVIVISNSGQDVEVGRLKELGATDYIVKIQMSPDEVYKKVSDILGIEMKNSDNDFINWKRNLTKEQKYMNIDGYTDSIDDINIKNVKGKYVIANDVELWKGYLISKGIDISKYRKPIALEIVDRYNDLDNYIGFSKMIRMELVIKNIIK